jgi:FtsP/CotA-like multicopper oxidase with cupredoxin domain
MNTTFSNILRMGFVLALLLMPAQGVQARIVGETGTVFNLTVRDGYISLPDGESLYTWGYAVDNRVMQYPGPTLIVNQGAAITVTLKNELPASAGNVSIVFPGHSATASGGAAGLLTREAPPDGATMVTYRFTATQAGTYTYHSGTRLDLQIDMGLVGAIIVRPTGFDPMAPQAYNHADSQYDREYLFFLTEMDPVTHYLAARGQLDQVEANAYFPVYWFINGRCAPDTMLMHNIPWLPHQPYSAMARIMPGEKMLMRMVGGGRDLHPFHHHGNNALIIAKNGRLLESAAGAGPDLAYSDFTEPIGPGDTQDQIFIWTGAGMGWDIYGHRPDVNNEPVGVFPGEEDIDYNGNGLLDGEDAVAGEDPDDHLKPFPVVLPEQQDLAFGGMYSGSPFLGNPEALPPGEGGMNAFGAFTFMWHSHNEKEMTTNDVFPGGMMTMCFVEPPGTPIDSMQMP